MSVYNTLPGTPFITLDGGTTVGAPAPRGDIVCIVAPALDGPTNRPIPLQSQADVERLFGPLIYTADYAAPGADTTRLGTYSGNLLVKTVQEVLLGGASNILMVRVGGNFATSATPVLGGITVASGYASQIYNGATLTASGSADGTVISCTQPASKGGSFTVTYPPTQTLQSITAQFNHDPRNATFQLSCPTAIAGLDAVTNTAGNASVTVTLSGGTYGTLNDDFAGLSKAALYQAITQDGGTFDHLDGIVFDILYVAGIYADDDIANTPTQSFLTAATQFAYAQSEGNYPMIVVMGMRPATSASAPAVKTRVQNLTTVNAGYDDASSLRLNVAQFLVNGIQYTDASVPGNTTVDIGRHLSILAGPDLIYPSIFLGAYAETPASLYAGFIASLPAQRATTNQPLTGTVSPAYTFTRKQLNLINAGVGNLFQVGAQGGGAFVTLSTRQPGVSGLIVIEDVTAAARTSQFTNLQTFRIVQAVERVVQRIGQLFIGQPNSPATITALTSQLQSGLDSLADQGALTGKKGIGYDFQLGSSIQDSMIGKLTIRLSLVPANEIRQIVTTVSVGGNL